MATATLVFYLGIISENHWLKEIHNDTINIIEKTIQMVRKELMEKTGMSPSTVAEMTKGEPVNMQILWENCTELDSDIGELVCINKSIEEDK